MAKEERNADSRGTSGGSSADRGPEVAGEAGSGERATAPLEVSQRDGSDGGSSRTTEVLAPGTRVGRYEIVELVGSGGAGKVYRARDPQLERFVALKLLHAPPLDEPVSARTQALLLQEARTVARLSHPNVVAAFDVGVHEGALFVAMEFIDRVSMRDWLAEPRTPSEILRVLVAAGRGLAAAHDADVCHRDFKPANVMIASDGRVLVVDFGLARTFHFPIQPQREAVGRRSDAAASAVATPVRAGGDTERLALSTASALAGTPGFMAPELLRGREADARSDQYSYAVTAFLALTGVMPYPTSAQANPSARFDERRAPWHPGVRRRIRRVIERGLEPDPNRRYPSLAMMVSALERAAAPRISRGATIALGAAAAALAAAVAHRHAPTRCNFDTSSLAGVWDAERRTAVERAFQATGRSNQADTFERISSRLDVFRDEWVRHRQEACEASQQGAEPSERMLALRTACLDGALAGAKTLVNALSAVNAADIDRVAGAAPPPLRSCLDTTELSEAGEPPSPELEGAIAEVDRQIAGVTALIKAGFRDASIEAGRLMLEGARATGHAPTIAKAAATAARANLTSSGTSEQLIAGETLLREGMRLAADSGQDLLLARMSTYLLYHLACIQTRIEESAAMLPVVEALVSRVGSPTEPHVELLMGRGRIELEHRRFAEALATLEEAVRLAPSADDYVVIYSFTADHDISQIRMELGQFAAAVQAAQHGLDGTRDYYGPGHPRVLFALGDLAVAQGKAGQRDAAAQSIAEARRLATTLPANEPRLKNVARAEGVAWEYLSECDRALPPLNEALQLFTAAYGPSHPLTAGVLAHVGTCLAATGHLSEAIAAREQVLSTYRAKSVAPILLAESAFALAKLLWPNPKQQARALALIEEANSLATKADVQQLLDDTASWLAAQGR
jgi:tetratricopeptide (TPR) repeat protein